MMNKPDDGAAAGGGAGPWWCCYNDNDAGEASAAAAVPTTGESGSLFADVVADYSTDELFELVCEQEGKAGGGASSASMQPVVSSCLWSPRFSSKPPDVPFDPPSEDEMAAWLGAIVKGEEKLACNDDDGSCRPPAPTDDGWDVVPEKGTTTSSTTAMDKKEKIPTTTTEGMMMMGNKEMRKVPTGGSSRSHHGEAHNLTEKRRRHKINERLKILQQLVPGCSKSNEASTLDQTIHYMKSLQHQVQVMSVGLAAPAVYPVVQPQYMPPVTPVAMPFPAAHPMVLGGQSPPTTMVAFGVTMLHASVAPFSGLLQP